MKFIKSVTNSLTSIFDEESNPEVSEIIENDLSDNFEFFQKRKKIAEDHMKSIGGKIKIDLTDKHNRYIDSLNKL